MLTIDDLTAALKEFDVEATMMQGWWKPKELQGFDLLHIRHCNFTWSQYNFDGARASGVPYVVTPMFYPRADLGMDYDDIRGALEGAVAVVPQSWREWDEIQEACQPNHIEARMVEAVPNGTDARFHAPNANGGHQRKGVLCVSARAGDKNTRLVQMACERLGLPYKEATTIDHKFMPLVYRQFRVFVNASDSERMSRTVGEALCAGCRVVAPVGNRGNEWYGPRLHIVDPQDAQALSEAIDFAYHSPNWDYSPNEKARAMTWRETARRMSEIYREVLVHA